MISQMRKSKEHLHKKFCEQARKLPNAELVIIGDSIVRHFEKYPNIWTKYFKPSSSLRFGISGDRVEHVLFRVGAGEIPIFVKKVIVHVGTNNLHNDEPLHIGNGIFAIAKLIKKVNPKIEVIISGILPRKELNFFNKISEINNYLEKMCFENQLHFVRPTNWSTSNGNLDLSFYWHDLIHLSEMGYIKFSKSLASVIKLIDHPLQLPKFNSQCSLNENYTDYAIGEFEILSGPSSLTPKIESSSNLYETSFPPLVGNLTTVPVEINSNIDYKHASQVVFTTLEEDFPPLKDERKVHREEKKNMKLEWRESREMYVKGVTKNIIKVTSVETYRKEVEEINTLNCEEKEVTADHEEIVIEEKEDCKKQIASDETCKKGDEVKEKEVLIKRKKKLRKKRERKYSKAFLIVRSLCDVEYEVSSSSSSDNERYSPRLRRSRKRLPTPETSEGDI